MNPLDGDDDQILKLLSNQMRRRTLSELAEKGQQRFSALMRAGQLNPNSNTGLFLFHIHRLSKAGAIQNKNGLYWITQRGQGKVDRLSLLTQTDHEAGDEVKTKQHGRISIGRLSLIDWVSEIYQSMRPLHQRGVCWIKRKHMG